MAYQVKLEQFEGPFELLLNLIEEEKLKITEISLSKVTEQYIKYLSTVEELYPEELADFLVVATKLLLIKSRTLLPYLKPDEEDQDGNLEEQLKIYREFHEAAQRMEKIIKEKRFTYGRVDARYLSPEIIFTPPTDFTVGDLRNFFQDVLDALEPIIKLPKAAIAKAMTLKDKISHLQRTLAKKMEMNFKDLISQAKNKTEVIVTFLALLELVKQEFIYVSQKKNFEDIIIKKVL